MAIINQYGIWIKGMTSCSIEAEEVIFSDSDNQKFHIKKDILDRIQDLRQAEEIRKQGDCNGA